MEGFNEQKVRDCVKLPKRYQIASIISFGYEPKNAKVKPSARFDFGGGDGSFSFVDKVMYDGDWEKSFFSVFYKQSISIDADDGELFRTRSWRRVLSRSR